MLYLSDAGSLTIDQLHAIPVPSAPRWSARNTRWQPVPHGQLASAALRVAQERGFELADHAWTTNPSGTDLFGSIDLVDPQLDAPDGTRFSLGLRHSNAGNYAVGLAFGARVTVCENGLLAGSLVLAKRHISGLNVEDFLHDGFDRFLETRHDTHRFIDRLRTTPLDAAAVNHLLMEAARADAVPWSMLGPIDRCWESPPYAEFEPRTAWSLYNAFTQIIKKRSAKGQMETLLGLRDVFTGHMGQTSPEWSARPARDRAPSTDHPC